MMLFIGESGKNESSVIVTRYKVEVVALYIFVGVRGVEKSTIIFVSPVSC